MSLIKSWIIERFIAKIEMIETNATNVICNRKSKNERKHKRKRKRKSCEWKFWLQKKNWLQRNVKNVWHFVWRKNWFFWQNKTTKRYRFRERMLLKTFRIQTFSILINRRFLIDYKQKINDDTKLICDK